MKIIVSKDQPPPHIGGVLYWERCNNPFDPGIIAAAIESEGFKVVKSPLARPVDGWLAIEWGENPVGFYSDGMMFDCEGSEQAAYHFTDVGPSGHRIAERALNSLQNARWFQSHGYILVRVGYNSRTVIEKVASIDCHAIIMHTADVDAFGAEFATVPLARTPESPQPSINSKPLFIVPETTEPPMRAALEEPGEFIVVMKRHGLKPKGTISEFE